MSVDLKTIEDAMHAFVAARLVRAGFEAPADTAQSATSLVLEASEVLELYQWAMMPRTKPSYPANSPT